MAKFNPTEHIESLDYDFTMYGGREGTVPEPSTGRVQQYFKTVKQIARDAKALQQTAQDLTETADDMSDEEAAALLDQIDEKSEEAQAFQHRTLEALAVLCGGEWVVPDDPNEKPYVEGGSPSVRELEALPYRVLQAFNQWLMGEIAPKKTTPATKR